MDSLKDLISAHPKLFRGLEPPVPSRLPPGWYSLVDKLCSDIEAVIESEFERFAVNQIKEKFGGLRFYFELDGAQDMFVDLHGSDGINTVVTKAEGVRGMDAIRKLVDAASNRSRVICEECGAAGTCVNRGGWLSTLCETHAVASPRAAITEEDLERQRKILTTPRRTCAVITEYVDSNLRIADAREEASGRRVSISWNTKGVDWDTLRVGSRLVAKITALNHAVEVRLADPPT